MKSFYKYIKKQFLFIILLTIFLLILTISSLYFINNRISLTNNYRETLNHINNLIKVFRISDNDSLKRNFLKEYEYLNKNIYFSNRLKEYENYSNAYFIQNKEKIIKEISLFAQEFGNNYENLISHMIIPIYTLFVLLILLVIVILVNLIVIRLRVKSQNSNLLNVIDIINQVLGIGYDEKEIDMNNSDLYYDLKKLCFNDNDNLEQDFDDFVIKNETNIIKNNHIYYDRLMSSKIKIKWDEDFVLLNQLSTLLNKYFYYKDIDNQENLVTLEKLIPQLVKQIEYQVPIDRMAVAFIDTEDNVIAESAYTKMNSIHLDPGYSVNINKTTLYYLRENNCGRIINDLENHYENINKSSSTQKILLEGIKSSITLPIIISDNCVGFLFISSRYKNTYNYSHVEFVNSVLNVIKKSVYSHYISQKILAESAYAFVSIMENKDNETANHIRRMSLYSYTIAKQIYKSNQSISPSFMREILWFAPLHDIGKIGISENVLLKPGKLNENEFSYMKTHVNTGRKIIKKMNTSLKNTLNSNMLQTAIDIISDHHERYDGKGYPQGKKGEEISLAGRIVALADVFDALTSKRPYKEAFSIEKSLSIMERELDKHFDSKIYNYFINCFDEIMAIYEKYKEI